jgi:hypothetical protein
MPRRSRALLAAALLLATLPGGIAHAPAAAAAEVPAGAQGYWMAGSDGAVYRFGDAAFFGSLRVTPAAPVVGMAAHPDGIGYWLLGRDGGIFTFGSARFLGSTGNIRLNQPVVGMAPTASGSGYWLVATDGGIFAFGDAPFLGSTGDLRLNRPIVRMVPTPSGNGYWMVASDGGIFAFGDAPFFGSTGNIRLNQPIVGMAATPSGNGYWLVATDGGIFAFGDARFHGSTGAMKLRGPIVDVVAATAVPPYLPGQRGFDISWPQCGKAFPQPPFDFAIVGVTNGSPFTTNPCLAAQVAWAEQARPSAYVVLSKPVNANGDTGPAGTCAPADERCRSYNFGYKAAAFSVARAQEAGFSPEVWWLDVETPKPWSSDKVANARVVQGAIDYLQQQSLVVGIYSTYFQWGVIAGDFAPGLPIWIGGAPPATPARTAPAPTATSPVAHRGSSSGSRRHRPRTSTTTWPADVRPLLFGAERFGTESGQTMRYVCTAWATTAPSESVAVISVNVSSLPRLTVRAWQTRSDRLHAPTYCTDMATVDARVPFAKSWFDQAARAPAVSRAAATTPPW